MNLLWKNAYVSKCMSNMTTSWGKIEEISLKRGIWWWKENENFSSSRKGILLWEWWKEEKKNLIFYFGSADKKCEIRVRVRCIRRWIQGLWGNKYLHRNDCVCVFLDFICHWLIWHWLSTRGKADKHSRNCSNFCCRNEREKSFLLWHENLGDTLCMFLDRKENGCKICLQITILFKFF